MCNQLITLVLATVTFRTIVPGPPKNEKNGLIYALRIDARSTGLNEKPRQYCD